MVESNNDITAKAAKTNINALRQTLLGIAARLVHRTTFVPLVHELAGGRKEFQHATCGYGGSIRNVGAVGRFRSFLTASRLYYYGK